MLTITAECSLFINEMLLRGLQGLTRRCLRVAPEDLVRTHNSRVLTVYQRNATWWFAGLDKALLADRARAAGQYAARMLLGQYEAEKLLNAGHPLKAGPPPCSGSTLPLSLCFPIAPVENVQPDLAIGRLTKRTVGPQIDCCG